LLSSRIGVDLSTAYDPKPVIPTFNPAPHLQTLIQVLGDRFRQRQFAGADC